MSIPGNIKQGLLKLSLFLNYFLRPRNAARFPLLPFEAL